MKNILHRNDFREAVFSRDNNSCVVCGKSAQDAHHILERRLFSGETEHGGYFLDNGASLCGECHIKAEQTVISVDELRTLCNITHPVIPEHFYPDTNYDKWGNVILPNGRRCPGELFDDYSVQKVLGSAGILNLFSYHIKYPRTWHIPQSPGTTKDDRKLKDLSVFVGKEVVITEKMDGENTTITNDSLYSRAVDGASNSETQGWVRKFASRFQWELPVGIRLCGENLHCKHSIGYENLSSFFLLFSIWDKLQCLSWDETKSYAEILDIPLVPVIYKGEFSEKILNEIISDLNFNSQEGFVIRTTNSFTLQQFKTSVAKYVRPGHVQTSHGWKFERKVFNKLN